MISVSGSSPRTDNTTLLVPEQRSQNSEGMKSVASRSGMGEVYRARDTQLGRDVLVDGLQSEVFQTSGAKSEI